MAKKIFTFFQEASLYFFVATFVVLVLILVLILYIFGQTDLVSIILKYALILGSLPLWYGLLKDILKGSFGVDLIAGVALIGTFLIGQYLAGIVVLLMLSGGQVLEVYAMSRARRELKALLSLSPEYAHVKKGNEIVDLPIDQVIIGMQVIVKTGEIVPVDGVIVEGQTRINESTLSGESMSIEKRIGNSVFAGTENQDGVIIVSVEKESHETKYQTIVALVKQAEENKAPLVRLADRYSLYFTLLTFIIALSAWFISHDFMRVVSVLVVATPCPLILATPIALLSGMSKASTRGIIVKDGGALEALAKVDTLVFDKTGTVTLGTPEIVKVVSFQGYEDDILVKAASLDQLSTHILARALTDYVNQKNLTLKYPTSFKEQFGDGVFGEIDGVSYAFGKKSFITRFAKIIPSECETVYENVSKEGMIIVFLASKDTVLGAVIFADSIRDDASTLFKKFNQKGLNKTILLTGDKKERAEYVAKEINISKVISDCLPEDKLRYIIEEQRAGSIVAMIGDGVNDAPALAQSDAGIALGSHGKTASSDVADIVILSQSISRVYDIWHIASKTISLAKQGIFVGIGASTVAMILSAFGYISPLTGALLQEAIDIVVIINALRLGQTLELD